MIALVVGLISLFLLLMCTPEQKPRPKGIFLPSGSQLLPSTTSMDVHLLPRFPTDYQNLGTVQVELKFSTKKQDEQRQAIVHAARIFAARAGANGLVIQVFGHTSVISSQSIWILRGIAIHTESSSLPLMLQPGIQLSPYN